MPNHIHGIIQIQNPNVGATLAQRATVKVAPTDAVAASGVTVAVALDAPGAVAAPGVTVESPNPNVGATLACLLRNLDKIFAESKKY